MKVRVLWIVVLASWALVYPAALADASFFLDENTRHMVVTEIPEITEEKVVEAYVLRNMFEVSLFTLGAAAAVLSRNRHIELRSPFSSGKER